MAPPHFLVTGAARSGTGYTATLFTELGVPCGHEQVFGPRKLEGADEVTWPADVRGESSWLAAPFLASLPPDVPVLHQVREPVAVVRSKLRTRFFEVPSWYKSFAEKVVPDLLEGTPTRRALAYWVAWNRLVEEALHDGRRPTWRYRIEDLDAELLACLLDAVGSDVSPGHVAAVLARHPQDYNTRGAPGGHDAPGDVPLVAWDDLRPGPLLEEARAMATRYGYGEPQPDGTLAVGA